MSQFTQSGQHPDADQLTAFVEHALPPHERERALAHLATCEHCRAIVALSLPPLKESPAPQPTPTRRPWFATWHLAWPAAAAFAVIVFVIIHLRNTAPIKSGVHIPTEIATSQPPAPLAVPPPPPTSPPAAKLQRPNQTPTGGPKTPSPDVELQGQRIAKLPIANSSYATLPPPQAAPTTHAINAPQAMDNIALAPSQSQPAIPPTLPQQSTVIAGNVPATAAPAPQFTSKARVATPSALGAGGAAISSATDSNANPTSIVIDNRNAALLSTNLPAAAPLPSRLPALSTAVNGRQVLAIDTQNTLFLSDDAGKHWTAIPTQWRGRAIRINLARPTTAAVQNAAITTTAASFGAIGGPVSFPAPTTAASVTGTITDATGAAIPNASITITNPTTKTSRTVTSDTNGHYRTDNLIPGNYQLEASATSFQKQQLAVNVAASQENQANLTLNVGAASETVTVEAAQAMPLATTSESLVVPRASLKKSAPKALAKPTPTPLFEITTDYGGHWTSLDGKIWTQK